MSRPPLHANALSCHYYYINYRVVVAGSRYGRYYCVGTQTSALPNRLHTIDPYSVLNLWCDGLLVLPRVGCALRCTACWPLVVNRIVRARSAGRLKWRQALRHCAPYLLDLLLCFIGTFSALYLLYFLQGFSFWTYYSGYYQGQ